MDNDWLEEDKPVQEFRIERNATRFRALPWGSVLLLIGVAVFIVYLRITGAVYGQWVNWVATLTFLGAFYGACILVAREALIYAKRQMVFVLEDDQIARKRQGYPDVKIAFSEIETLNEGASWLVITSAGSQRKVAIPKAVSGYETIRAELAKHHAISIPSRKFPLKGGALTLVSVLSWMTVVWFHDLRVVIPSAVIALALLGFASYQCWMLFRRIQKRSLAFVCLCCAWVAAILLIYVRVVRP